MIYEIWIYTQIVFFNYYGNLTQDAKLFLQEDKKYNFKYVVLYRKENEALHRYLYNDTLYACIAVDPVAAVYKKTDNVPQGDIFAASAEVEASPLASLINMIFNPLYTNFGYEEVSYDIEAAEYYTTVGQAQYARKRLEMHKNNYGEGSRTRNLERRLDAIKKFHN